MYLPPLRSSRRRLATDYPLVVVLDVVASSTLFWLYSYIRVIYKRVCAHRESLTVGIVSPTMQTDPAKDGDPMAEQSTKADSPASEAMRCVRGPLESMKCAKSMAAATWKSK